MIVVLFLLYQLANTPDAQNYDTRGVTKEAILIWAKGIKNKIRNFS